MLNGPLLGKIILFAMPVIIGSVLQQIFNAADTAVVGRFASSQALAAVGGNASTISLLINLFVGTTSGAGVMTATYIGRRQEERISAAVHTAMAFAVLSGLFLVFVGQFAALPLLKLMSSPPDVISLAAVYLRIFFCGVPFFMIYNMGAAILRSTGDTRRPLYSLMAAGVLNVLLNVFFVVALGLSVVGVALATVISNALNAFVMIRFLTGETGPLKLSLKNLKIHPEELSGILRIGLPAGLQGTVFSLSNVFIQTAVNGFGSKVIAGSAAALNFEFISYFALAGFVQACMNFTGQNYGAGNTERCRRIFRLSLLCAFCACMTLNFSFYAARQPLLGLFTEDPEVIRTAELRMRSVLLFQAVASGYEIAGGAMRGLGRALVPAVLTVFGTCVFRIIWVTVLFRMFPSLQVLFLVYPASWVLTDVLVVGAYFLVRKRAESGFVQNQGHE